MDSCCTVKSPLRLWARYLMFISICSSFAMSNPNDNNKCIKWGNTFDVPLNTKNIRLDCKKPEDGRRVCCVAVNSSMAHISRGVGIDYSYKTFMEASKQAQAHSQVNGMTMNKLAENDLSKVLTSSSSSSSSSQYNSNNCEVRKQYVSSPLEIHDIQLAQTIESQYKLDNDADKKFDSMLSYITSDSTHDISQRWLARVTAHMASESFPATESEEHEDDAKFLSYFLVTKTCGNGKEKGGIHS
jgi:hypothetical protein